MSNRIKNNLKNLVGQTLNQYYSKVKPTISDLRYKQEYQNRIIECMVGEVDDNYITTPETDNHIVKLEHSKEGIVKIPSIKGKTILVDSDGNETDTPGEGCRLVSVGENEDNKLIILSKNKNLFNKSNHKIGYIDIQNEGNWVDNQNYLTSDFISVKSNTTYIRSGIVGNRNYGFYNSNKEYISGGFSSNIMTPKDCKYIRLGYHITNDNIDNIQLEENVSSTFYVPHQSHKTEILLDEPLRSLPNGVYDEIVDNKLIRRVGRFVIDDKIIDFYNGNAYTGTENTCAMEINFDLLSSYLGDKYYHFLAGNNVVSNVYLEAEDVFYIDVDGFSWTRQYLRLSVKKSELESLNQKNILKKLNSKGFELLYELAEPIIEELPNGITLQGFDDTTMYIENSITPTVSYGYNALIPYKEELSNQKEEVETNTLDIEQNIIPYLMDMEFNLMLMEDE